MSRPPILDLLSQLAQSPEPVSFHDALGVVRALRGSDPTPPVVLGLVALHDAEHATDGARTVLADYLRALAHRHENQRRLAERPITLKDHGKIARAGVGAELQIRLDERRAVGFRWEVKGRRGPGQAARSLESNEFPSTAIFRVKLLSAGRLHLELHETPPPRGELGPPRWFRLTVVAESTR